VSEVDVLAVDVGATSMKFAGFSRRGEVLGAKARRPTAYPCPPERLVAAVAARAASVAPVRIGLGFPGEVADGVVLDAANLARAGGSRTPVDAALVRAWRGFDLRAALVAETGLATIVMNDAAMAAVGCAGDHGVELVLTLGTGCGLALVRRGRLVPARDVGAQPLHGAATFDDVLGERGRSADEGSWSREVVSAVERLAAEFGADVVHLAGGNARRLSPRAFAGAAVHVQIERGDPALLGAWRMWATT
jgi:polyphosphate glucokinase